jgi:hypothetical protein
MKASAGKSVSEIVPSFCTAGLERFLACTSCGAASAIAARIAIGYVTVSLPYKVAAY